jgi:hypothetical protein
MQDSPEPEEEIDPTAKSEKKKGKRTSWVHVAKAGATPSAEVTKQGAVFAEGTRVQRETIQANKEDS